MRTFDELLESYSPDVQELARSARKFVLSQLRGAQETVDASGPYIGYGFAGGYKGQACSLILSKGGVKLGIVGGAFFDDPHRLLQGSGTVHRHIVLKTPADLKRSGVKDLVKAAGRACRERLS